LAASIDSRCSRMPLTISPPHPPKTH